MKAECGSDRLGDLLDIVEQPSLLDSVVMVILCFGPTPKIGLFGRQHTAKRRDSLFFADIRRINIRVSAGHLGLSHRPLGMITASRLGRRLGFLWKLRGNAGSFLDEVAGCEHDFNLEAFLDPCAAQDEMHNKRLE